MSKGTVLLLKERKSSDDNSFQISDEYETKFSSFTYKCIFLPVLSHDLLNIEELTKILKDGPEKKYWGFVVTSQRAIEGLKLAWNKAFKANCESFTIDQEKITTLWKNLPFFVIGKATSEAMKDLKFNNILGDKRRDELPSKLSQADIKLDELLVYETKQREDFLIELDKIIKEHKKINWVIFFSPSGVDVALNNLQKLEIWNEIKVATIGKTTGNYLVTKGIKIHVISPKPEPEILVQSIDNYEISLHSTY
ncbi:2611_t:CDS:2 [Diversispora eburnea]|uniref:2611_t:CDS:1 n=1 Tax=Diversispora eburnea TaxID=1213867 RepID=A0A9N9A4X1_9GLOM|nr:2611_t:CDS:2 [Diversispora eburnea]